MTARALVLAAASVGSSTLRYPLRARDTELMAAGLRGMGTQVSTVEDDQWVVRPRPLKGPAHIDVGLAGTVATMAMVEIGLADYDRDRVHHFVLTRAAAEDVFRTLATERRADRVHNPGLAA